MINFIFQICIGVLLYKNREKIRSLAVSLADNFKGLKLMHSDLNKGGVLIFLSGIIGFVFFWIIPTFFSLSAREMDKLEDFTILPMLLLTLAGFFIARHD